MKKVLLKCAGIAAVFFILQQEAAAATLKVGPGKAFGRIEEAYAKAQPGDNIVVYPKRGNFPYKRAAVRVKKPGIAFRAAVPGVKISGKGLDYSDDGPVPRAIFQFDEGADNCAVEGFELYGARNYRDNGAGNRQEILKDNRIIGKGQSFDNIAPS